MFTGMPCARQSDAKPRVPNTALGERRVFRGTHAPRERAGMSGLGKKPAASKPGGLEDMIRTAKKPAATTGKAATTTSRAATSKAATSKAATTSAKAPAAKAPTGKAPATKTTALSAKTKVPTKTTKKPAASQEAAAAEAAAAAAEAASAADAAAAAAAAEAEAAAAEAEAAAAAQEAAAAEAEAAEGGAAVRMQAAQRGQLARREATNRRAAAATAAWVAAEAVEAAAEAAAAAAAMPQPVVGQVRVRYNHYKEEFDVVDGVLDFEEVDEQYCISYVFKGDWKAKLIGQGQIIAPDGGSLTKVTVESDDINEDGEEKVVGTFSGLTIGGDYTLQVKEDAVLGAPHPHALLRARAAPPHPVDRAYRVPLAPRSESAAQGLRGFWRDVWQARQLQRERRRRHGRGQLLLLLPLRVRAPPLSAHHGNAALPLSRHPYNTHPPLCCGRNPCASSYNCKDWHNRNEVAKKNGWKGFS